MSTMMRFLSVWNVAVSAMPKAFVVTGLEVIALVLLASLGVISKLPVPVAAPTGVAWVPVAGASKDLAWQLTRANAARSARRSEREAGFVIGRWWVVGWARD